MTATVHTFPAEERKEAKAIMAEFLTLFVPPEMRVRARELAVRIEGERR